MDNFDSHTWGSYFCEIVHLLEAADRQYGIANQSYAQYVLERLEICLQTCRTVRGQITPSGGTGRLQWYLEAFDELISCLQLIRRKWEEYQNILDSGSPNEALAYCVPVVHTGRRGRPRFDVTKEQLEYLASLWSDIAALFGVSRTTIFRRRADFGMLEDPSADLSDEDLLAFVSDMRSTTHTVGESLVTGSLRSRGYRVSRERVRQALRSSDPLSSALRWPGGLTHRRPYSVAGPNSLWHIDGHHKLVRWKFITHAGIDGYSRLIVYLKCSTNNRASTVYELFLRAIQQYHLPSRVRSDQGRENIRVAQHMIEHRGAERHSIITGSSVHNQRIERLWRDVHQSVTLLYYRLFYYLEQHDLLDPLCEQHLYALHYVFVPRINKSLEEFRNAWNHHRVRTAHQKSPHQLFTAGLLLLQHSGLTALDFFNEVDHSYGIDKEGPEASDEEGAVVVPELNFQLSPTDYQRLRDHVDPLSPSENYGIDLYEQTVQFSDSL
jgi:hypothetical protein